MSENSGMKEIILKINKLQETFKQLNVHMDIDLPQIAVVGIQSSGKSSVLEKFVGRDFLPRGTGIVTRRPLILQLIHHNFEYAKFDHSEKKFTNFEEVRKEIEDETDRVTGKSKGISNLPIILKVFSPSVLNLTLIDLPGITKVPIGDQPSDIEHQIRSMIFEYIEKETCLILAVTPATIDLANSEALKIAREVDPKGKRTIGVITKLDLMDEGTNAIEILENKIFPLDRGYVGVINRSQKNIDARQDMKTAAEQEMKFFRSHSIYKKISNRMGTGYLQEVLNKQLTEHIIQSLPEMKKKMKKILNGIEEELKDFDVESNVKALNGILASIKRDFQNEMGGHGPLVMKEGDMDLTFGTKIKNIFNEILLAENFGLDFSPESNNQLIKDIEIAIRNATGMYNSIFVSEKALDHVIVSYINKIKEPIVTHVDQISVILQKVVHKYVHKITKYPKLKEELQRMLMTFIMERENLCKERLIEMIDCEMAYINKIHEDFKTLRNEQNDNDSIDEGEDVATITESVKSKYEFIYKGYMQIYRDAELFFLLSADGLFIFKNEDQRDGIINWTPLNCLNISDYDRKKSFKLTSSGGKFIYKVIICPTPEVAKNWIDCFEKVGISVRQNSPSLFHFSLNDRNDEETKLANGSPKNTLMKKQVKNKKIKKNSASSDVEIVRNLVESYLTM
ncbi:hypothetical protein PVAND_017113 [Polypedilum vanderplanki]|uniref:dynamin GTPase n=1 Tax=Polypedilum vanderplanki TaxID=319348 RepID=A0A9J6BHD2_POLVA|nr:hypothetical protein PVAND_017113 [Polypedilum vanderplanki]